MKKIKVANIQFVAKNRPVGYEEDVLSRGIIENGFVTLEDDVYTALQKKYSPHRAAAQIKQNALTVAQNNTAAYICDD